MSLTGVRQELADALSTVDGVAGYLRPPIVLNPGDGWPILGGLERDPSGPFLVTWRVVIILPADEVAALERLEELAQPLIDALTPAAYVTGMAPITYAQPSGPTLPAVEITMIRE